MNTLLRWLLPVVASVAPAADPHVEPLQVRADLQIIHLDEASAVPLIAQFTDEPQRAGVELQRLLSSVKATLAAHLIGRTSDNTECKVEQIEERRHAMEFSPIDPASIPIRKAGSPSEPIPFPSTRFEVRQIGTSLSITPFVYAGGQIVSISTSVHRRDFGGMDRFESGVQRDGTKLYFELPINFVRDTGGRFLVHAGVPTLIGCRRLQKQKGRFELHVLTTQVRHFPEMVSGIGGRLDSEIATTNSGKAPALLIAQTRIELHRFIVPEADALRLRPSLLASAQIESAFANLLASARKGRGELAGLVAIPLQDGESAVFGNDRNLLYPTELSFRGTPMPAHPSQSNPPSVFENRDVGDLFEAEAKTGAKADTVELQFRFGSSGFHGFHRWPTGGDVRTNSVSTYSYQPDFSTRSTGASISLANRQRTLLRFQKLPAPDGRVEIALIRAVIERFIPETKP